MNPSEPSKQSIKKSTIDIKVNSLVLKVPAESIIKTFKKNQ